MLLPQRSCRWVSVVRFVTFSGRPAPSMGVVLMEAPSAQAVTLVGSEACSSDNARTQTLPRQLTVDDYSAAA